jgi:hypothetical protein
MSFPPTVAAHPVSFEGQFIKETGYIYSIYKSRSSSLFSNFDECVYSIQNVTTCMQRRPMPNEKVEEMRCRQTMGSSLNILWVLLDADWWTAVYDSP